MAQPKSHDNLYAIVDMGSNGIRFSISDLSPPTARVMPTVFQDRAAISLYDAQAENDGTIPEDTVDDILLAFHDFKQACNDFRVPEKQIEVIATEATRTAKNSEAFRGRIQTELGWEVKMLPKEEEGRIGAFGVASSFQDIEGLVMDLGGGSTQLSLLEVTNGNVEFSVGGSVSLPYGAAALSKGLKDARHKDKDKGGNDEYEKYAASVRRDLQTAFEKITSSVAKPSKRREGISLFLSGGGFRGWGYIIMDQHKVTPYPIAIINGFSVSPEQFENISAIEDDAKEKDIFRVSGRRADQVPAVAFLVQSLCTIIPAIKDVRFAQGGVREGWLFSHLDASARATPPLAAVTAPFAPGSAKEIEELIREALPGNQPAQIDDIVTGFVHLLYAQMALPKESRAPAALRSTTCGVLAGAHGLIHEQRAALALALCERWGSEVSPNDENFLERVRTLAGPEIDWWSRYLGQVGNLIGTIYPSGMIKEKRVSLEGSITNEGMTITIDFSGGSKPSKPYEKAIKSIEKVGKKKHWIGGKHGWGIKINVDVKD